MDSICTFFTIVIMIYFTHAFGLPRINTRNTLQDNIFEQSVL